MIRTRQLTAALIFALALAGCSSSTAPAAAPTASAPTSAAPSPNPTPSASPLHKPKHLTTMTDEGGYCTNADLCGVYVAGSSCKGIEWCKKDHLVEPGTWETDGSGGDLTGCMWELSAPPKFGLTDGGYATTYRQVDVPKGAIFSTDDCASGWKWVHP